MEIGLFILIASGIMSAAILIYVAIERLLYRKWGETPHGIGEIFKSGRK